MARTRTLARVEREIRAITDRLRALRDERRALCRARVKPPAIVHLLISDDTASCGKHPVRYVHHQWANAEERSAAECLGVQPDADGFFRLPSGYLGTRDVHAVTCRLCPVRARQNKAKRGG